jgi:hypothetical protein
MRQLRIAVPALLAVVGLAAVILPGASQPVFNRNGPPRPQGEAVPLTPKAERAAEEAERELFEKGTASGDAYCTPAKEEAIAALELGAGPTVDSPRRVRRGTERFLAETRDAPRGAWCVDQEVDFLRKVWKAYRGDHRAPYADEYVERLRELGRR